MISAFSNKILFKSKITSFSTKWTIYWLSCLGIYSLGIHSEYSVNTITGSTLSLMYYFMIVTFSFIFFKGHRHYKLTKDNVKQLTWIFISFVTFVFLSPIVNWVLPLSDSLKSYLLKINLHYPLFYYTSSAIKIADIIFQQVLIYTFVMQMKKLTGDKTTSISLFTLCFFVIHIPLIVPFKLMAFFFIIPSLFAGIIFSSLILYYNKWGLLLSILVHEMFYLCLGSTLRFMY